jgi:hypothetical protein
MKENSRALLRGLIAMSLLTMLVAPALAGGLGDVFYIDMENHNFVQPDSVTSPQQLLGNPAAPFFNSLITPGNPNAAQTSYAGNYQSAAVNLHPSLANCLWQEQGTNNGVITDNPPFGPGGENQGDAPSLSGLLQANGTSWKSYQEDIDLATSGGLLTSTVLPQNQWTVPLNRISGTSSAYTNPYNGSHQYDFAPKHDGQLYFNATNGGNDASPANPLALNYAPLQQLQTDLTNNTVARYNLITPNQFNDMHTPLDTDFTYGGVTYSAGDDQEAVAVGDNFLSMIIPAIQASQAYQNNGAIVIWFDETEGDDSSALTLPEIVISPLAKGNAYESLLLYTHSSDLKSMEELFGVMAPGGGFLGDANTPGTNDLSDLFVSGAITAPEPSTLVLAGLAAVGALTIAARQTWSAHSYFSIRYTALSVRK